MKAVVTGRGRTGDAPKSGIAGMGMTSVSYGGITLGFLGDIVDRRATRVFFPLLPIVFALALRGERTLAVNVGSSRISQAGTGIRASDGGELRSPSNFWDCQARFSSRNSSLSACRGRCSASAHVVTKHVIYL